jgi:PTS system nitrogen regulatory IIA component
MDIAEFLSPADVLVDVRAGEKTQLLKELCRRAASRLNCASPEVFDAVVKREKLGSTGVGEGIAIPHARLATLEKPFGVFARLQNPIDFDAIDGRPVDLVFLLLLPAAPEGGQLGPLASVARSLRDARVVESIRNTRDANGIYNSLRR